MTVTEVMTLLIQFFGAGLAAGILAQLARTRI
jgi:hypothetical protein